MKLSFNLAVLIISLAAALYGTVAWAAETKTEEVQMEKQKMLFLCYWELNENVPVVDHLKIGKMLTESGLFPPQGVEIIRFDITPDYWGVTVFTAESAEAAFSLVDLWRVAGAGFFKKVKVTPAMPVNDAKAMGAKLYQAVKEAEAKMQQQKETAK